MPNRPSTNRPKTTSAERAIAACTRACDAHDRVTELAKKVADDIDEVTLPGVPVEIHEEDSIVTVLETAIESHSKAAGG